MMPEDKDDLTAEQMAAEDAARDAAEEQAEQEEAEAGPDEEDLSPEAQLEEAIARIVELEAEAAQQKDRALRAVAEAENARRIAQQDRERAAKYAAEPIAKDLIEVAENLNRALMSVSEEVAAENEDLKQMRIGVSMAASEFAKAFTKHGIEIIDPVGGDFDPNHHQAMGEVETADIEPGKVAVCFARGYVLKDRLLRPAMVQLAKAPA